MVARNLHFNSDGEFISLQYVLIPLGTDNAYAIDLPRQEDWHEFFDWLDSKFKAAGKNPKFLKGVVQDLPNVVREKRRGGNKKC